MKLTGYVARGPCPAKAVKPNIRSDGSHPAQPKRGRVNRGKAAARRLASSLKRVLGVRRREQPRETVRLPGLALPSAR